MIINGHCKKRTLPQSNKAVEEIVVTKEPVKEEKYPKVFFPTQVIKETTEVEESENNSSPVEDEE